MARVNWLDDKAQTTVIDDRAQSMESFVAAMADGVIDASELSAQEARLVAVMKKVEPMLDDATHESVTELLTEMSAFSTMQTLNCLLYTSPSPRDQRGSRMPSSA